MRTARIYQMLWSKAVKMPYNTRNGHFGEPRFYYYAKGNCNKGFPASI